MKGEIPTTIVQDLLATRILNFMSDEKCPSEFISIIESLSYAAVGDIVIYLLEEQDERRRNILLLSIRTEILSRAANMLGMDDLPDERERGASWQQN